LTEVKLQKATLVMNGAKSILNIYLTNYKLNLKVTSQ